MVFSVPASLPPVFTGASIASKIWLRLGKPLASRTSAKVIKGQSLRFSFDFPLWALSIPKAEPSK